MKTRLIATLLAGSFAVIACGVAATSETLPESVPATVPDSTHGPNTVTITQQGGCVMMGPNCSTWILEPDGSFELRRTGQSNTEATGTIDQATATELWDEIAATDFNALVRRLGPGTCQACVDGIDTIVEIAWDDETVVLDSAQVEFSSSDRYSCWWTKPSRP